MLLKRRLLSVGSDAVLVLGRAAVLLSVGCGGRQEWAGSIAPAIGDGGHGDAIDTAVAIVADADAPSALLVSPAEFTEEGAPLRMLASGDAIDLWRAPQGGHVVLLGARVKNTNSKAAALRVRMRRPETGFIVAEEARTVAMVPVHGEPGTMQPDIRSRSQVAHVPLCPDYDSFDVVDQPLDVEIQMTALYTDPPVTGTTTVRLVPSCREADGDGGTLCRCECSANYALGKCGGLDRHDAGDGGAE